MVSTNSRVSAARGPQGLATLVILCRGLERTVPRLNLTELSDWLSNEQGVQVRLLEDLCDEPRTIREILRHGKAERLVLGQCVEDIGEREMQAYARKAGLDPLGIQLINLARWSDDSDSAGPSTDARAKLLLKAAICRAKAFPGSRPENMKSVLPKAVQRVSRRALFTLPPISYVSVPTINRDMCSAPTGCDQCVRVCPLGALEKDGDRIVLSRSKCQSCGLCMAACPQRAVEFPGWSAEELEAEVSALLGDDVGTPTKYVAFVCKSNSTKSGGPWLPVKVPCVSMVTAGAILQTLASGAEAVALSRCNEECPTKRNEDVQGRIGYCREVLRRLGDPSHEYRISYVDSSDLGPPDATNPYVQLIPGERSPNDKFLFGRGTAASGVMNLARRYGVEHMDFEHSFSPLGQVKIDEKSCTGCGTCAAICPTGALFSERQGNSVTLVFDASLCTACGLCETLCPESEFNAISVCSRTSIDKLAVGAKVVFEDKEVECEICGSPIATQRMLDRIATILQDQYVPQAMGQLCTACRGI